MITDEAVADFIAMTASGPEEARGYLEMAGGDLQQAMNLFLEMSGGASGSPVMRPTPAPTASGPMGGGGPVVDADVAAEVAAAAAAAGIDTEGLMGDATMADAQEEVRAPMPAFQDQMIDPEVAKRRMQEAMAADAAAMERRMSFDRASDRAGAGSGGDEAADTEMSGGQAINQLFAPPHYNEQRPYYEMIEKAKVESKWVLVNVQQAEVFASHQLNRDVWSHATIEEIVLGSFIFWQRDDKSTEGVQFCSLHQCGHQLPHICVIDPRTGRRVKAWDGRKWVDMHAAAEYLFGFLDEFSLSKSPPSMSPVLKPQAQPETGGGELVLTGLSEMAVDEEEPAAAVPPKEPVAAMPEEPAETTDHLKVSLRLPTGQRITRRFLQEDTVETMFAVASALAEQPVSLIDLSTQFPKRSLRDIEGGLGTKLRDAQVAGSMIVVTVRAS
eukprot:TRINITY_DN22353_c0_g1_i1.p1 TRINITY_DN22353_c0_g1~~TRINITY_DN22353_c0_g1_i1.p1  ORF type:complete len:442 (-),score=101.76 TRINITY_DN22353_c0_g1_i1:96-1421(-)